MKILNKSKSQVCEIQEMGAMKKVPLPYFLL
jgi:hypothetical protein